MSQSIATLTNSFRFLWYRLNALNVLFTTCECIVYVVSSLIYLPPDGSARI